MTTSRGQLNLSHSRGRIIEQAAFDANKDLIKSVLQADAIEDCAGSLMDKVSGIDAIATKDKRQVGVSLRVRKDDYGSITLSRNISDKHSQVHTLLKTISGDVHFLSPAFIVQLNGLDNNNRCNGTIWRINAREFAKWIQILIDKDILGQFFNPQLLAYEFKREHLSSISGVVFIDVLKN